jgi:twitching motility protein PilT
MRTALHAAETGHLVLSTLHTASAVETVDRLLDSFPADEQPMVRSLLAATLLGVLSQVLAPKAGGGMVGVFEVLIGTSAVKALINKGQTAQLTGALQTGGKEGMQSFEQHLASRVKAGLVSLEDALVIAKRPDELKLYLAGGMPGMGAGMTGLPRR